MGQLIKSIFLDILELYKNFLHFNISKILIYLVSLLIALVLALPFLIIGFIYLSNNDYSINIYDLLANQFLLVVGSILGLVFLFFVSAGYYYSFLLLNNLNLNYIERKKLDFTKNYYFNFKMFGNYIKLFFYNFLILLSPVVLFTIGFFVLIIIFGGYDASLNAVLAGASNSFSVSLVIWLIICSLIFFYLSFRLLFSYVIFVQESKGTKFKKASYYIKESFNKTKNASKIFKFLIIGILVYIITLPIYLPEGYFALKLERVTDYMTIKYNEVSENQYNLYYAQDLELEFSKSTEEELYGDYNFYKNLVIIFSILEFLFINGLFNMMIVSFYKRELETKIETKTKVEKKEKIEPEVKVKTKTVTKPKKATTKKTTRKPKEL
ncbi:MAG: hypothetical protein PHH06_02610 [Candidatus Gracilibacteria bacterium]|nr:hypothetical protein [Candidatus Gracilibacteria bacterium]